MQFNNTRLHNEIEQVLVEHLKKYDILVLRADNKEYCDDLLTNILTYMHVCHFGIAIYERITENDFNPNVSFEVGYMMGLDKSVCILKDNTLKTLHSDLAGKIYKPFDTQNIEQTLVPVIDKWLVDKEIIGV